MKPHASVRGSSVLCSALALGFAVFAASPQAGLASPLSHQDLTAEARRVGSAVKRKTTYQGFIQRWGYDGTCTGGAYAPNNPDLIDVFVITDTNDEVYAGTFAYNCDGLYYYAYWNSVWDACVAANGCPMLDGTVYPHQ